MTSSLIRTYLTQKPIFDEEPAAPNKIEPAAPVVKKEVKREKPTEMESLFGKLAPDLVIDPPIVLLYKEKSDLPFLKKVAEAITKFVETAECRPFDEKYFSTAKVVIGRATDLGMQPHQFEQNPLRLGIYEISEYQKSVELKRALWKLLQSISDLLE
ncbi:MAG: hypothetical protein S4CHLAM81_06340 [Chlamydiales bacterium]|nr:hypothetical protein [Chlamydiales bacterium]MCH9635418.1 hypothetical protein [Chlamydiales bacterium]